MKVSNLSRPMPAPNICTQNTKQRAALSVAGCSTSLVNDARLPAKCGCLESIKAYPPVWKRERCIHHCRPFERKTQKKYTYRNWSCALKKAGPVWAPCSSTRTLDLKTSRNRLPVRRWPIDKSRHWIRIQLKRNVIKYSASSFVGGRLLTSARTAGEFNIIDGYVAAVLQQRQIGHGFQNESVRVGRAVGHVAVNPLAAGRVGRQPDFVHNFLPSGLVDDERLKWKCPRRSENAVRLLLFLMPLRWQSWHQNAVDDERSRCVVGCGAVTFKGNHLDAQ